MAPKYHCFRNYSRLYGVPGIPSREEQREDFMRRIAGLPYQVVFTGRSIMRDPYDVSGTPDRVCILVIQMEYRKP